MKSLNCAAVSLSASLLLLGSNVSANGAEGSAPASAPVTTGLTSVEEGAAAARAEGMPADLVGDDGIFARFTNIALLVVGLISVVMLIYGGIRYIVSGGDSKKVTDAKNTILYAIIGLIIALLSYAIVNFILTSVIGVGTDQLSK